MSVAADGGTTALHMSAQDGHLAVTLALIEAGAELDAWGVRGATPLHLASQYGHAKVVAALVEAGAEVDNRAGDGQTPLYMAALDGRLDAVKVLLRANADPMLTAITRRGFVYTPLDVATNQGHAKVVFELIQKYGIECCRGGSRRLEVLSIAAKAGHVDIVALLMDAGVVDLGEALVAAAGCGRTVSVDFLLQRRQRQGSPTDLARYVNSRDVVGFTPLFRAIEGYCNAEGKPPLVSPTLVQLLLDAGADTSVTVRFRNQGGWALFDGTPLDFTSLCLREKKVGRMYKATEEDMNRLEALRRLLLRAQAARASSWMWPDEPPLPDSSVAAEVSSRTNAGTSAASGVTLTVTLSTLRRRSRCLRAAPLFR